MGTPRRVLVSRVLLVLASLLSIVALAATLLAWWRDGTPGSQPALMAPSTPVLLLLLATAHARLVVRPRDAAAVVAVVTAGTLAMVMLAVRLPGTSAALDQARTLFPVSMNVLLGHAMSPVTPVAILLISGALLAACARGLHLRTASGVLAMLATLLGATASIGYLLDAPLGYGPAAPMSAATSVTVSLLGLAVLLSGPADGWPLSQFGPAERDAQGGRRWVGPAALGIVISAAVIGAAGSYLTSRREELRQDATAELTAAADAKRGELALWIRERFGDAQTIVDAQVGADEIRTFLRSDGSAEAAAPLRTWAESLRSSYGYSAVEMYDAEGRVLFRAGAVSSPAPPGALASAIRDGRVVLDDLRPGPSPASRQMIFLAPVRITENGRPDGVVVVALVVDARKDLYPMLARWPFRSSTAETVLAKRDGDAVLYLTDLQLPGSGTGPLHRVPMTPSRLVLARALTGSPGPFEGLDYTDVPVLAVGGPIAATSWLLLVKADLVEVYAPFWREVRFVAAFSVLLLLTVMFGLIGSTRQQLLRELEARLALARERNNSTERLRSALRASLDPFIVLDGRGRILEWNEQAERTFGWTPAGASGQDFTTAMLAPPDDRAYADALADARRGLASTRLATRVNVTARRRDGSTFPAEVAVVPVHLHDELLFSAVVRDVTEQVRAAGEIAAAQGEAQRLLGEAQQARLALLAIIEEQRRTEAALRDSENLLESRVEQRTQQLEAANRELEAFSYSVSHDLRAPLRAIAGYARMLDEDHGAVLDEEGRRRLQVVQREAARMGTLIDDLLRFSRLGRQALAEEPIDMTGLARAVFDELLASYPPDRAVAFRLHDLPGATGDARVIRQVWVNLLGNALKFTTRQPHTTIEVDGAVAGAESTYVVRDNGVGFEMQYADKLFGVFQRLHSTADFEGSGVGLALAQRIIGRHGGRIWAEGRPGEGATFHFTLPASPDRVGLHELDTRHDGPSDDFRGDA
ncbi:MAG: ATP-binding protein [Vicinamibacterales bacterium]